VPAGLTFAGAVALYVRTLLPDVGTWDTAEFQAIGPVLGIAHPTGFPTYTLLAWVASVVLQPFGNEAYRADLLSALLVAGAAALTAVAAVQLTRRAALGLLAGAAFAVMPVAWRVGVRADAHALHLFLAALILVLLIEWRRRAERAGTRTFTPARVADRPGLWLIAASVAFGLALGNHALTLLLAPGIAVFVLLVEPRIVWRRWRLVLGCAATIALVTILVYAYIPLRSSMVPPLDYAMPRTPERFWYLVLGQQFQSSIRTLPPLPDIVARAWTALSNGYGALAVLAVLGLGLGLVRHAREIALTALWFAGAWLFALTYANAAIERYYLVPLLVAALWAALAVDVLWDGAWAAIGRVRGGRPDAAGRVSPADPDSEAQERSARLLAGALVVGIVGGLVLGSVPGRFGSLDASNERFGRIWLEAALEHLEPDAVVVSWWSFSTPLWYGRWVEGRRPDLLIIDDRDILDDGYGTASAAIDRWLPERPVYLMRLAKDLPPFVERYVLERVDGVPSPGDLYRVVGRRVRA
jgi:4-amino-4-deoxy-L-arabinose transferase-like glycosyltransferase